MADRGEDYLIAFNDAARSANDLSNQALYARCGKRVRGLAGEASLALAQPAGTIRDSGVRRRKR